jgi:hypothetical protein
MAGGGSAPKPDISREARARCFRPKLTSMFCSLRSSGAVEAASAFFGAVTAGRSNAKGDIVLS